MGISLYIAWNIGLEKRDVRIAMSAFGAQLALNAVWSVMFFGLRSPFLAFAEILVLWVAIASTILLFYRLSIPAGMLLIPYIIWVSIAVFLNYSIWIINI